MSQNKEKENVRKGVFILAPMGSGKTTFVNKLKEMNHPFARKFIDGDEVLKFENIKNKNKYWYPMLFTAKDYSRHRDSIAKELLSYISNGYNILYSPNPELFFETIKRHMSYVDIYVLNKYDTLIRWGNLRVRGENGGFCPPLEHFRMEDDIYHKLHIDGRFYWNIGKIYSIKSLSELIPFRFAIAGKARSGKDTVGEYLAEKYNFIIHKFAGPLCRIMGYAQGICGFKQTKDRQFLQYIGTEWARVKDENIWVSLTMEKINKCPLTNVVITDLRFENEFETLKKEGFILIRIKRNEAMNDTTFGEDGSRNHASELGLDGVEDNKFDYVLHNNSSLEDLYQSVEDIVKDMTI